jgi:hypothetical protein
MEAAAVVVNTLGSPKLQALATGALALLVSRAALACPACATRSGGGWSLPLLLGAMILTPYLVATVVLRIFRKIEAERAREEMNAPGEYRHESQSSA